MHLAWRSRMPRLPLMGVCILKQQVKVSTLNFRGFSLGDTRTMCLASHSLRNLVVAHRTVMISLIAPLKTWLDRSHLNMTSLTWKTAISRFLVWLACLDPFHCGVITVLSYLFLTLMKTVRDWFELASTNALMENAGTYRASLPISGCRHLPECVYIVHARFETSMI